MEKVNGIKILYACESGSRNWGGASNESDYDVRFIYVHPPSYYLSIDPIGIGHKRDVIEQIVSEHRIDLAGWELTKTLRLFRKSNPSLLEWLHSGIVYYQNNDVINKIHELLPPYFRPRACLLHYVNMAKGNLQKSQMESGFVKGYLNVLRPILMARWIKTNHSFPPTNYSELIHQIVPEGTAKDEIESMLKTKLAGYQTLDRNEMEHFHQYIQQELQQINAYIKTLPKKPFSNSDQLDKLFRSTLEQVFK